MLTKSQVKLQKPSSSMRPLSILKGMESTQSIKRFSEMQLHLGLYHWRRNWPFACNHSCSGHLHPRAPSSAYLSAGPQASMTGTTWKMLE